MATAIASGLGESFGIVQETSVGTYKTVSRWIMHDKAEFMQKKKTAQSQALHNSAYELASRRRLTSYTVDGSVEYEVQSSQFGILFQNMIGSSAAACAPVNLAGAAYLQTHIPATLEGLTLSGQKGVPQTNGTVAVFSESGLKITDWEIAVGVDEIAKMALTMDGWKEVTDVTLTAPVYLTGDDAPELLAFPDGSFLIGGTASSSAGVTSVSGGAAPTGLVKSVSIKGSNKVKQDRFFLGSLYKAEQIRNAFSTVTGEVEIEFANLTDFYDTFVSDVPGPVEFSLVSPIEIGSTGFFPTVDIILPSVRWEGETPNASGPEVITVKVPFTALQDDVGGNPIIQISYTSVDTAV